MSSGFGTVLENTVVLVDKELLLADGNPWVHSRRMSCPQSGVIPAESTVETLSIVAETKVSEANCRLFSPQARFFFEIRVS